MSSRTRESIHYVNNAEFSKAVVEYVTSVKAARAASTPIPTIPEYIGSCLLKIAEGLSRKPNFIRYTYREDMVMDAVENCVKAVVNFNVDAQTRSKLPNAFAYFTQICFYAFIRRIQREKKAQDLKVMYMENAGIENFANFDGASSDDSIGEVGEGIVERMRRRVENFHQDDPRFNGQLSASSKKRKKRIVVASTSSSLDLFL